jgi:hypothetical protein
MPVQNSPQGSRVLDGYKPSYFYSLWHEVAKSEERLGYGLEGDGFESHKEQDILSSPKCPDRLWG